MKRRRGWLVMLVVGLLIVAATFSPPLNPPQCPDHATRMPDGSNCIIGANIGAGLLLMLGTLVTFIGAVGSLVSLVTVMWELR